MHIPPVKHSLSFNGYIYGKNINNKKVCVDTTEIGAIEKFGNSSIVTKKDNTEILFKAPFPIVAAACAVADTDENKTINIDKFDLVDYWNMNNKDE